MKLRAKTFITIAATMLVLLAAQYALVKSIVEGGFRTVSETSLSGFASIEDRDTRRNIERVTDALSFRIETLETKVADWSQWDDTYRFVKDKNRAFVESNLGEDALTALKINMLLIVDDRAHLVYGAAFDLEDEKAVKLPPSLERYLTQDSILLSHDSPDHVASGILSLPEGPLMIVSRPIVKSNGEGPMRGSVIFGRFLDPSVLKQLADMTHLSVVASYLPAGVVPEDFKKIAPTLNDANPISVTPKNDKLTSGYTAVKDLEGKQTLLLRIDVEREIHQQGLSTGRDIQERGEDILKLIVVSLLVTGVVVCLVIGGITERWILTRLGRLSGKARKIGELHDFSLRVKTEGKDEMASLGKAINQMLEALEATHHEIETHNAEMRLLMDTVPVALLSVDENSVVNPEYSAIAESFFQTGKIAGAKYTELLGLEAGGSEAKSLLEFLSVMRDDLIDDESMAGLNPLPEIFLQREGPGKWLKTGYYLIRRKAGQSNHLLVVVEDVTEKKRLSAQISRTERENLQLKAIAEDPELFREFLVEADKILKSVAEKSSLLKPGETARPLVNEIFRGVHTLKGVSGSFGLAQLSVAAGELEERLDTLRRDITEITPAQIAETDRSLKNLIDCFGEASASAKAILGDDPNLDGGVILRVSSEEIAKHMEEVRALGIFPDSSSATIELLKREALARFAALRSVPARRGLARSLRIVPGLIDRLAKNAIFNLTGAEQLIDCDLARELNTPLVHMIRNAIDHGVEPSEARARAGKTPAGSVSLQIDSAGDWLTVRLSDDGRGLDPAEIRNLAVSRGLVSAEEAERLTDTQTYELIFTPGFTTSSEVSEISGRGVGMDVVRQSIVTNLKGSIEVASEKGKGTVFTIRIPLAPC